MPRHSAYDRGCLDSRTRSAPNARGGGMEPQARLRVVEALLPSG
jgi:hypothetical protein